MIISNDISTISDLRFKTKAVLNKAARRPVILFHRSSPKGLILSMEKYNEMISDLEDYYLSLKAEEYESEDKDKIKWLSHKELKKQLV